MLPLKQRHIYFYLVFFIVGAISTACGPVKFSGDGSAAKSVSPLGINIIPPSPTNQLNPSNLRCGGPADASLYTLQVELVKVQSQQTYGSYAECQAARASIFANSMVCSKMVSSTVLGCLTTSDFTHVVMELDLALPVLKASNQMEVPYDYFLLGVPNCDVAKNFINATMTGAVPTSGNFTNKKAVVRADCLDSTNLVVHTLQIY